MDDGEDLLVLDVREPHEYEICHLRGHLIPLGDLPRRVHELDSSREIVAYCKIGARSAKAVEFLREHRLPPCPQPHRRYRRLGGADRSDHAPLLKRLGPR